LEYILAVFLFVSIGDGLAFMHAINTIYERNRKFILLLQYPQIHKPIYIQII